MLQDKEVGWITEKGEDYRELSVPAVSATVPNILLSLKINGHLFRMHNNRLAGPFPRSSFQPRHLSWESNLGPGFVTLPILCKKFLLYRLHSAAH